MVSKLNKQKKLAKLQRLKHIREERAVEITPEEQSKALSHLEYELARKEAEFTRTLLDLGEIFEEFKQLREHYTQCLNTDAYLDRKEAEVLKELERLN